MNKNMFMSKLKLHGDTIVKLAQYLGISTSCLSAKINEWRGAEFNQKEISKIKDKYFLDANEINEIFFNAKVS